MVFPYCDSFSVNSWQLNPVNQSVWSVTSNSATQWTVAHQALLSMGFPGRSTGVGCHFLLQGIFPTQELKPRLLCWQADSWPLVPPRKFNPVIYIYRMLTTSPCISVPWDSVVVWSSFYFWVNFSENTCGKDFWVLALWPLCVSVNFVYLVWYKIIGSHFLFCMYFVCILNT